MTRTSVRYLRNNVTQVTVTTGDATYVMTDAGPFQPVFMDVCQGGRVTELTIPYGEQRSRDEWMKRPAHIA